MIRFSQKARWLFLLGIACAGAGDAIAQTTTSRSVQHVNFDSPEGWALKYFTSATILSGLQPPEPLVEHRQIGSITVGLESGWLPALSPEQARAGFSGRKQEDLNKAPIFVRPSVRVGLPWRFTAVVAGTPPLQVFGITPRLFAFGLERPIVERNQWSLSWRASGQVGSVKAAFTCPQRVLGFPAGSPENPSGCIAQSADRASLRYGGTEVQFTYRIPKVPKLIPHAAAGLNFIDSTFQVNAPLETHLDRNRLWTRGMTFSGTAGVSYLFTNRIALTVDAFYSPLWVRRDAAGPRKNEGLFNVRALISYTLR